MAKGYWIPHLDVSNLEGFQAYRETADAWHKTNGSRLLARGGNPFPDGPPKIVRARLYLYRFTTPEERRETGDWWKRELVGEYLPAIGVG